MKQACIDAVARVYGRALTQEEARDIENRVRLSMRKLAAEDPQGWQKLSAMEQTRRAGEDAAQSILSDAALKRHRVALTILTRQRAENYIESQAKSGADPDGLSSIGRMLEGRADGKNNITSVWSSQQGIFADASRFLTRTWDIAGGKFLHLLRAKAAEYQLIRALHGAKDVPEAFRKAAADFHMIAENLRQRFNAAGGEVGRLENWGMPHAWSMTKLLKAGQKAWTDAMLPLLDRSAYIHEDGSRYTDEQLRALLDEAWLSVTTEGANKVLGGDQPSGAIKANRHSAERQIHLKDAESTMQAMQAFSERGVLDSMLNHVRRMSRDISLVEQFGPNADLAVKQLLDEQLAKAILADPKRAGWLKLKARYYAAMYNVHANGDMLPVTPWGRFFQGARNLNLLKLGMTWINSFGDYGTMNTTAKVNGIPFVRVFLNHLRAMNPLDKNERAMAASAGLMARAYSESISRFGLDMGATGWTSKLGNTVLRLGLAPYMWQARQRGFSYGMMNVVGRAVRDAETLDKLNEDDQRFIKHSGITDTDWKVLQLAQPEEWGGNETLLTPSAIYRIPDEQVAAATGEDAQLAKSRAASNLMGLVYAEQDRAIPNPGLRARVALGARFDPDMPSGIFMRSFSLFKSFPFDITYQHMTRALGAFDGKPGAGIAYAARLIATTTLCGAIANTLTDMLKGNDPRTLNPTAKEGWSNWLSAVLRGGGLGIYGDLLFGTYNQRGSTIGETLEGPVLSDMNQFFDMAQQAFAHTPDAETARQLHTPEINAVRTARSYVPGANLWYLKAVLDHLIFNELNEYLSPGYLARMKARARQHDHASWWEPDETTPRRAPDLSHMTAAQQ